MAPAILATVGLRNGPEADIDSVADDTVHLGLPAGNRVTMQMGKSRLEAFSDGVLAIIITIWRPILPSYSAAPPVTRLGRTLLTLAFMPLAAPAARRTAVD